MKAHTLAAALDGRVIGATDAEISRAVHPAEASCDGDVAIAVSPDTIRILGECRAKIALVPEGAQFPRQRFQTVIFMRGSRTSLPEITQVFRHRPDVQPGVHPSAVVAPNATIGEGATVGANTVVTRDLEPWGVYLGNRRLRDRDRDGVLATHRAFLDGSRP